MSPVIVLSDDGDVGSVRSTSLSTSSLDEVMMKCMEAEEAKYNDKQVINNIAFVVQWVRHLTCNGV